MPAEPDSPLAEMGRGAIHQAKVFDLAQGDLKHAQIAAKFGCSVQAVHQFAVRNRDEIDQVKRDLSGVAVDVYGVQKREQLALISAQIVRAETRILSGELTPTQVKGQENVLSKAVHQLSELTGNLPQRMAVQLETHGKASYEIPGVDIGAVIRDWGQGSAVSEPVEPAADAAGESEPVSEPMRREVPPEYVGRAAREEAREDDPGEPVFR